MKKFCPKKEEIDISPAEKSEIDGMDKETSMSRLITAIRNKAAYELALKNDDHLKQLREQIKEIVSPNKEQQKLCQCKINYIIQHLKKISNLVINLPELEQLEKKND